MSSHSPIISELRGEDDDVGSKSLDLVLPCSRLVLQQSDWWFGVIHLVFYMLDMLPLRTCLLLNVPSLLSYSWQLFLLLEKGLSLSIIPGRFSLQVFSQLHDSSFSSLNFLNSSLSVSLLDQVLIPFCHQLAFKSVKFRLLYFPELTNFSRHHFHSRLVLLAHCRHLSDNIRYLSV